MTSNVTRLVVQQHDVVVVDEATRVSPLPHPLSVEENSVLVSSSSEPTQQDSALPESDKEHSSLFRSSGWNNNTRENRKNDYLHYMLIFDINSPKLSTVAGKPWFPGSYNLLNNVYNTMQL